MLQPTIKVEENGIGEFGGRGGFGVERNGNGRIGEGGGFGAEKVVLELEWSKRFFGEEAGYTYRKMGH